jgi:hypothetical protein
MDSSPVVRLLRPPPVDPPARGPPENLAQIFLDIVCSPGILQTRLWFRNQCWPSRLLRCLVGVLFVGTSHWFTRDSLCWA